MIAMTNQRSSRKSSVPRRTSTQAKVHNPALPRWRWLIYLGAGVIIFVVLFVKMGGVVPEHYASFAEWYDSDALTYLVDSGIFTGLIVALLNLFLDPVFLGIAQRKSKLAIAKDLLVSVAATAAGVAAEGLLEAAASNTASGNSGGSDFKGGGGSFGGGGASGDF